MTDAKIQAHSAIDMTATMERYATWEAAAAKLVPDNRRQLFAHLASANITRVVVIFDGEGDSGQIEDIQAYRGEEQAPLPNGEIETLDLPYGEPKPITRRHSIPLVVETLAYDLLRETHEGWENSDGAYGEFVFDVTAGTITLDYNDRYMSSENHVHAW